MNALLRLMTVCLLGAGGIFAASLTVENTAQAAACARGVYRAGCVGPNGAVAVRRAPVVRVAPVRPVVVAPRRRAVIVR